MKILPAFLIVAASLAAQERTQPPVDVYRADIVIRDDAGKPRRFSMLTETGGTNTLRLGTKIPFAAPPSASGLPSQVNYVESGLNLELRLRSYSGKLSLRMDLDLSSVQVGDRANTANPPVTNVRTSVQTMVQPKKPTVLASIEDPSTTRRLDIEVTLTQVE
jgi:hypothetical protein